MRHDYEKVIETYIKDVFQPLNPNHEIFYPNMQGSGDENSTDGWSRVVIQEINSEYASLGRKLVRVEGLLLFQIFFPINTGAGKSREFSNSIFENFSGVCMENVRFYSPQRTFTGAVGAWYQTNYQIPFYVDYKG